MHIPTLLADAKLGPVSGIGNFVPVEAGGNTSTPKLIDQIFSTVLGFLTIVAGLTFLIYFVIGALSWLTAGGDEKKVDDAKKFMTNGAIGLIVVVASYSIISIIGTVLGIDILNPGAYVNSLITGGH